MSAFFITRLLCRPPPSGRHGIAAHDALLYTYGCAKKLLRATTLYRWDGNAAHSAAAAPLDMKNSAFLRVRAGSAMTRFCSRFEWLP